MNKRIKELAEQAHKYAANDPRANITVSYVSIFEEKFAELVDAVAVAREREACAKFFDANEDRLFWGSAAAKEIRGRTE
jgi:CRISPR/Cas system-associated protein Cas10 (large subunit of type III CRISPR-Cas system)